MATSVEKVPAFMREAAERAEGPIAAAAPALLPMIALPDDPAVLDELLGAYAALLLTLRSDDAPALHIAWGEAQPAVTEGAE